MAFPKNEINNFILGSEDGNVYSGKHHSLSRIRIRLSPAASYPKVATSWKMPVKSSTTYKSIANHLLLVSSHFSVSLQVVAMVHGLA